MVEEAHLGEGHGHAVLVAAIDHNVVTDRSAGLGDILDAASLGALDVVIKREEGIRAESYAVHRIQICADFGIGQGCGLLGKVLLPVAVSAHVLFVAVDIAVYDIIPFRSTQSRKER